MSPLIPFIRAIVSEFSNIASQPLGLLSFNLVNVVLCPRMTLYACPMFANIFLVRYTHSDISLPRTILSIYVLTVLTLTGIKMIFIASFIFVDCMSVPYVAVRPK